MYSIKAQTAVETRDILFFEFSVNVKSESKLVCHLELRQHPCLCQMLFLFDELTLLQNLKCVILFPSCKDIPIINMAHIIGPGKLLFYAYHSFLHEI